MCFTRVFICYISFGWAERKSWHRHPFFSYLGSSFRICSSGHWAVYLIVCLPLCRCIWLCAPFVELHRMKEIAREEGKSMQLQKVNLFSEIFFCSHFSLSLHHYYVYICGRVCVYMCVFLYIFNGRNVLYSNLFFSVQHRMIRLPHELYCLLWIKDWILNQYHLLLSM